MQEAKKPLVVKSAGAVLLVLVGVENEASQLLLCLVEPRCISIGALGQDPVDGACDSFSYVSLLWS